MQVEVPNEVQKEHECKRAPTNAVRGRKLLNASKILRRTGAGIVLFEPRSWVRSRPAHASLIV